MKVKLKVIGLAVFSFFVGIIILLEQVLKYRVFFEIDDIHHETFALVFIALGLGVLIGSKLSNK
jgi:hypothetical protein